METEAKEKKIETSLVRFTRREIREYTGWGNTQLKVHFNRLEELEYLISHQGGRGKTFVYELLYGVKEKEESPFTVGLFTG